MKSLNVLVVEDKDDIIELLYKPAFSKKEGINIDYATSEMEAKEKIRSKYYHIAYVDIMLREDRNDRGGVEVIKHLHELNEPTSIIVVSATDDIKVALDTYKAGIYDYIQKESIQTDEDILTPLEKLIETQPYKVSSPYGRFTSLNAFLAFPELIPYWDDQWVRHLGTSFTNFTAALHNGTEYLLPLLRRSNNHGSCLQHGKNDRTGYDYFWSKRLGKPIMISLAFPDSPLPTFDEKYDGKVIYEKSYKNLNIAISVINSGLSRSEFLNSIWDEQ